jgi:4-hydroxythreonine-4-phosphate dehydrogenase
LPKIGVWLRIESTEIENMSQDRPIIAITLGDVAGIGPEIVLRAIQDVRVHDVCRPLIIGPAEMLVKAESLRSTVGAVAYSVLEDLPSERAAFEAVLATLPTDSIPVVNPCDTDVLKTPPGEVSATGGDAAFQCLTTATQLALSGMIDGIATAPLNKESLHAAGHKFPGHTEILANQCGVDDFAMMLHLPESRLQSLRQIVTLEESRTMLQGYGLSVAHVTLHTSIASVPQLLTTESIVATTVLMDDFLTQLGSDRKAIGVAALNPHGGEHGLFGNEEAVLITPAVEAARAKGCNVTGPLPVDTLIRRAVAGEFDGVIAMYHDQGHIPLKLMGFDSAINITLGLPIVRTSPTHGTAFDRAWNPDTPADPAGMTEAIIAASQLRSVN